MWQDSRASYCTIFFITITGSKEKWTHLTDEAITINKLTGNEKVIYFNGDLHYFFRKADIQSACRDIVKNHYIKGHKLILGFDIEWPPNYVAGVPQSKTSLIQICPSENTCYLFHVYNVRLLPKVCVKLLSSPAVKLVGLNIKNDVWKLGRDFDVEAKEIIGNNVIDIGVYAKQVLPNEGKGRWSLQRLVEHCFHKDLIKSHSLRLSNWRTKYLTNRQKIYAATDAFVSLLLYKHLKHIEDKEFKKLKLSTETEESIV